MNRIVCFIALCSLFFAAGDRLVAQTPKNPILFVTVVPNVQDSATQSAMFGNHLSGVRNALRGGDLWVRYPDGTRKNLTKTAGFGTEGLQGETSIAVREPSVHWNGTKAVFSMIVGAPVTAADTGKQYYWQMYEITGLGATETPVITKVPNQPAANNISPAYGTDGRILFISDRPRIGYEDVAYRYLDENIAMPSNSGLWSLNPMTGDIKHLDHSPSGDFNPTVDSYGRVIFTRWDILQQDRLTFQVRGNVISMPFNHTDEGDQSPRSPVSSGSSAAFPEENPDSRLGGSGGYFDPPTGDPIVGGGSENSGIDPRLPNDFFPWAINEDGSEAQTVNHIGRHDVRDTIPSADFMTSSGVKGLSFFRASQSNRANKNPIVNAMHIKEDPR
ncbi:MAG: hypothetical protein JNL32_13915, partial [Candidatus Kapabacteria bacterium]|nr:hypothetical protein [Candidatus Kapabacteria bacterium]